MGIEKKHIIGVVLVLFMLVTVGASPVAEGSGETVEWEKIARFTDPYTTRAALISDGLLVFGANYWNILDTKTLTWQYSNHQQMPEGFCPSTVGHTVAGEENVWAWHYLSPQNLLRYDVAEREWYFHDTQAWLPHEGPQPGLYPRGRAYHGVERDGKFWTGSASLCLDTEKIRLTRLAYFDPETETWEYTRDLKGEMTEGYSLGDVMHMGADGGAIYVTDTHNVYRYSLASEGWAFLGAPTRGSSLIHPTRNDVLALGEYGWLLGSGKKVSENLSKGIPAYSRMDLILSLQDQYAHFDCNKEGMLYVFSFVGDYTYDKTWINVYDEHREQMGTLFWDTPATGWTDAHCFAVDEGRIFLGVGHRIYTIRIPVGIDPIVESPPDDDNDNKDNNDNNNGDDNNDNGGTPPPSGGNDSPPPSGGGGTSPPNGGDSGEGGTGGDTPPSNGGGGNGENGNGENGNGENGNGENGNGENGNGENGNGGLFPGDSSWWPLALLLLLLAAVALLLLRKNVVIIDKDTGKIVKKLKVKVASDIKIDISNIKGDSLRIVFAPALARQLTRKNSRIVVMRAGEVLSDHSIDKESVDGQVVSEAEINNADVVWHYGEQKKKECDSNNHASNSNGREDSEGNNNKDQHDKVNDGKEENPKGEIEHKVKSIDNEAREVVDDLKNEIEKEVSEKENEDKG